MKDDADGANRIELVSDFVRHRNAMLVRADFGPLYEDHYLHLMQSEQRLTGDQDTLLKEALAGLVLHLMSNPRDLSCAWTINFRDPPLNLFVTGDSSLGNVVGRVFTKDVKVRERNLFYGQASRHPNPVRQSTVEFEGHDMFRIVESYYDQSEQFRARLFRLEGDKAAMVTAHPDCDLPWFEALTVETVACLATDEELGPLEKREYHFGCGCRLITVVKVLVNALGRDPEKIFAGEDTMKVGCPRCAGTFTLDRPAFDSAIALLEAAEEAKEGE
jgi:molecular chaperone Hsp33